MLVTWGPRLKVDALVSRKAKSPMDSTVSGRIMSPVILATPRKVLAPMEVAVHSLKSTDRLL